MNVQQAFIYILQMENVLF